VNSEELELSLRTEFENHLKTVLADMRQQVTEFQSTIEAEIDKHRSQMDEAFRSFTERLGSDNGLDEGFNAIVGEHLRLARDEGAKITAEAFAEAEKLEKESAPSAPSYDVIRDAVNEIGSHDSQAGILKSLVQYAADFAPRGAFFIIKSDHLAGWKVFGADDTAEAGIREVHLPVSADTIVGAAVRCQQTVEGSAADHQEDGLFTDKLGFGSPEKMFAIPLVARGKAVAVLYADQGDDGAHVNREGLETLVRVAGLTVELHAVVQTSGTQLRDGNLLYVIGVAPRDEFDSYADVFQRVTQSIRLGS